MGATLLPAPIVMKIAVQLLSSDLVSIGAIHSKHSPEGSGGRAASSHVETAAPVAEHIYDLYLQMYGVKKLAETHIANLVFSVTSVSARGGAEGRQRRLHGGYTAVTRRLLAWLHARSHARIAHPPLPSRSSPRAATLHPLHPLHPLQLAESGNARLETLARMAAFWGAPYLEHEAHLANLLYNELAPLAAHEDVDRAQSPQRPSSQGSGRSGSAGKERCGERFSSRGLAFMGSAGSGHQVFVASYPAALRTARSIFEHMQARHVRLQYSLAATCPLSTRGSSASRPHHPLPRTARPLSPTLQRSEARAVGVTGTHSEE